MPLPILCPCASGLLARTCCVRMDAMALHDEARAVRERDAELCARVMRWCLDDGINPFQLVPDEVAARSTGEAGVFLRQVLAYEILAEFQRLGDVGPFLDLHRDDLAPDEREWLVRQTTESWLGVWTIDGAPGERTVSVTDLLTREKCTNLVRETGRSLPAHRTILARFARVGDRTFVTAVHPRAIAVRNVRGIVWQLKEAEDDFEITIEDNKLTPEQLRAHCLPMTLAAYWSEVVHTAESTTWPKGPPGQFAAVHTRYSIRPGTELEIASRLRTIPVAELREWREQDAQAIQLIRMELLPADLGEDIYDKVSFGIATIFAHELYIEARPRRAVELRAAVEAACGDLISFVDTLEHDHDIYGSGDGSVAAI